ncbi:hypothetical protein PVL29_015957 [Vitis rotundifolia]|uniref:Uncharacterized protein n=1 Tax=Vitis rotundifolia TaxID=103349 RepID=A0AA39DKV9_VITRO|nr:hypothetical protein PVL29_015957 [Vitis rotundifolia]
MNHQTPLSARNLLAVIQEPQSYVLPIIPKRLPKVVVLGEYYVLKDLPFYEEACEADAKAQGTLRRALSENGRISSSATCPPVKKKKSSVKAVKTSVPAPASPFASTPSASTSTDSSAPTLEVNLDLSNSGQSDSGILYSEPEPIALGAINEPKLEEGMPTDLRPDFKERHRKRLHEAITVDTPPAKRTCPEGV